jgi:hypothetical protein
LALAACSSPKPGTPEFVQKKEEDKQEAAVKTVTQSLSSTPAWFTKNPVDSNWLYAKGTQTSDIRSLAVQKAQRVAVYQLGQMIGQSVTTKINDLLRDSGGSKDTKAYQQSQFIGSQDSMNQALVGWVQENDQVEAEGDQYRAYVMLRYPIGEVNKIVESEVKKNSALKRDLETTEAWKNLEKEIERYRLK